MKTTYIKFAKYLNLILVKILLFSATVRISYLCLLSIFPLLLCLLFFELEESEFLPSLNIEILPFILTVIGKNNFQWL